MQNAARMRLPHEEISLSHLAIIIFGFCNQTAWSLSANDLLRMQKCSGNSSVANLKNDEQSSRFQCPFVSFKAQVLLLDTDRDADDGTGINSSEIKPSESGTKIGEINSENYLIVGSESYSPADYCLDNYNATQITLSVCVRECTDDFPCIRKCCGLAEVWDVLGNACVTVNNSGYHWTPMFYKERNDCVEKVSSITDLDRDPFFVEGLPKNCQSMEELSILPAKNIPHHGIGRFRTLVNGSILGNRDNGSWFLLPKGSFCVDGMTNWGSETQYSGKEEDQILLVCKDQFKIRNKKHKIPLIYALMLLGAGIILLFTAIIFILLWDKHNIYEWTVFFEVLSMMFMILFVGTANSIARSPSDGRLGSSTCIFLGIASHFFFLATFFWLLIINFEIWWNFRNLTVVNKKSRRWLRLCNYQVFSWGGPTIMVAIGLALDSKYGLMDDHVDCSSIVVPNYGQLNCYISKGAQGYYLYFPIGVLLGFNLLFYFLTVFKMCQYQKRSQAMSLSRNRSHFQPVVVFARLFIVMGVSWIFEIVSWAITPADPDRKTIPPLYWIVFDIVTLLQAIAIFIIFICRKDIFTRLWEKYPVLHPFLTLITKLPFCNFQKPSTQSQELAKSPENGGGSDLITRSKLPLTNNITLDPVVVETTPV